MLLIKALPHFLNINIQLQQKTYSPLNLARHFWHACKIKTALRHACTKPPHKRSIRVL